MLATFGRWAVEWEGVGYYCKMAQAGQLILSLGTGVCVWRSNLRAGIAPRSANRTAEGLLAITVLTLCSTCPKVVQMELGGSISVLPPWLHDLTGGPGRIVSQIPEPGSPTLVSTMA